MALTMDSDFDEICSPTVKNTFIDMQFFPTSVPPRRKSVPASLRLCGTGLSDTCQGPPSAAFVDTDASTDALTDASNEGEDGTGSEFEFKSSRNGFEDSCTEEPLLLEEPLLHHAWAPSPSESASCWTESPQWPFNCEAGGFCTDEPLLLQPWSQAFWGGNSSWMQNPVDAELSSQAPRLSASASAFKPNAEVPVTRSDSVDSCADQPSRFSPQCAACGPSSIWDHMAGHTTLPKESQRLSAKASAFQPQEVAEDLIKPHFRRQFADVVKSAKRALQECEHTAHVEVFENNGVWSIAVRARGKGDDLQTDCLLTIAKEALLDAASQSKSIYVMGFYSPKTFTKRPQGFEATLGAMENAATACWHVFKRGFCRHGADCNKDHPAREVPVHVIVESSRFDAPVNFVREFKQEVADLALLVAAAFRESSYVEEVEALKDNDDQGWTIKAMARQEGSAHREYLFVIAKNAIFSATNNSKHLCVMGYASKPFVAKSKGFVAVLGDMQDETRACWNLYAEGTCRMDCACRWEHPECLMPINFEINAPPPQNAHTGRGLDCLADVGSNGAA